MGKVNLRALVPQPLRKPVGADHPLVGQIDPVVQTVNRAVEVVLRIGEGETRDDRALHVGASVSVPILQVEYVRSVRNEHAVLPGCDPRRKRETIGEDRTLVGSSVPVAVAQQSDDAGSAHVEGIAVHLHDVDVPRRVDRHVDRIGHHRLGRKELDPEPVFELERREGTLRGIRRTVSRTAGTDEPQHQEGSPHRGRDPAPDQTAEPPARTERREGMHRGEQPIARSHYSADRRYSVT